MSYHIEKNKTNGTRGTRYDGGESKTLTEASANVVLRLADLLVSNGSSTLGLVDFRATWSTPSTEAMRTQRILVNRSCTAFSPSWSVGGRITYSVVHKISKRFSFCKREKKRHARVLQAFCQFTRTFRIFAQCGVVIHSVERRFERLRCSRGFVVRIANLPIGRNVVSMFGANVSLFGLHPR